MAVGGRKRGSHRAGAGAPTVRGTDGRAGAAVDGLLARVARGDAGAFASVCDQVSGAVYGLVRPIVGDQSRADRVAAEVLVEVWRSASRFNPAEGSGLSWVMTMARRHALSHAGAVSGGRTATLAANGAGPGQAAASLAAHRGLAALPGPQREAVLLACCGCSWREMADLAGVPAVTVAERLRDGLRGLSGRAQ
jgi:RNA polymerase sigma-70 factor (ECF subfamily)